MWHTEAYGKKKLGRPPKYATEKQLAEMIDTYWVVCEAVKRLPNKAGLCLHLDISRDTYSEYRKQYPDTIKAADLEIEHAWVGRLEGNSPTGARADADSALIVALPVSKRMLCSATFPLLFNAVASSIALNSTFCSIAASSTTVSS